MPDVVHMYREGIAFQRQGRFAEAEESFRAILEHNPGHGDAQHSLGVVHLSCHDYSGALGHFEKAISLNDGKAIYHNNYGAALLETERLDEALAAFEKAIELDPEYADAWSNLGLCHIREGRDHEAEQAFQKALQCHPDHAEARRHLTALLLDRARRSARDERFHEAADDYRRASELQPEKSVWRWKSLGFCPSLFPDEKAIDRYRQRLDRSLDLAATSAIPLDWRSLPFDGFTPSFNLPHLGKCCREIKEKFARLFEPAFTQQRPVPVKRARKRIGFVVTGGHHWGFLRCIGGIVARLDSRRYEPVLFCDDNVRSLLRQRIRRDDLRTITLPGDFERSVHAIRSADCNVLYHWKVGGGPWDYFLPFAKASPVQCTSWGTHGTSGVAAVDWYLSAKFMEPEDGADHYTERLFQGESYPGFLERPAMPEGVSRNEFDLPATGPLYFCPHRIPKYHPSFDVELREILEGDPGGHIVVSGKNAPEKEKLLRKRWERNLGPSLMRRIRFVPYQKTPSDLLRLFAAVDVVLDSPVYAGGLTAYDAFAVGTPVVTRRGRLAVQNQTSGLYDTMGMSDLPTTNREAYVAAALRLGGDADYARDVRARIAERSDLLFGDDRSIRDFERFFEIACENL